MDANALLTLPLAAVFLYHGATKQVGAFAKAFDLPRWVAGLVIFAEIAAGLGFLFGAFIDREIGGLTLSQWAALAAIPVLLGAIYLVHWNKGFNVSNGGFEYQLVLLGVALYQLLS